MPNPFSPGEPLRGQIDAELKRYGKKRIGFLWWDTNEKRARRLFKADGSGEEAVRERINTYYRRSGPSRFIRWVFRSDIPKTRALYYYRRTRQDIETLGRLKEGEWQAKAIELLPTFQQRAKRVSFWSRLSPTVKGIARYLTGHEADIRRAASAHAAPLSESGVEAQSPPDNVAPVPSAPIPEGLSQAANKPRHSVKGVNFSMGSGNWVGAGNPYYKMPSRFPSVAPPLSMPHVPLSKAAAPSSEPSASEEAKAVELVASIVALKKQVRGKLKGIETPGQLEAAFGKDSDALDAAFSELNRLKPSKGEAWLDAQVEGLRAAAKPLYFRYHPDKVSEVLKPTANTLLGRLKTQLTRGLEGLRGVAQAQVDFEVWSRNWDAGMAKLRKDQKKILKEARAHNKINAEFLKKDDEETRAQDAKFEENKKWLESFKQERAKFQEEDMSSLNESAYRSSSSPTLVH